MRTLLYATTIAAGGVVLAGTLLLLSGQEAPKHSPVKAAPAQATATKAALQPSLPPQKAPPTHMFAGVRCPGDSSRAPLRRLLELPGACELEMPPACATEYQNILVSAPVLPNRLVHDCQKLLVPGRHVYGPLVALQPAVFDHILKQTDAMRPPAAHEKPRETFVPTFVLADILNFSGIPYPRLNIYADTLNCLVVRGDPRGDPRTWAAEVLQSASCTKPIRFSKAVTPLEIKVIPYSNATVGAPSIHTGLTESSHKSTARWGWDGVSQYLGVNCGWAWCEFGPRGFKGSRAAVGDVLGLRDEQFLAEADPTVPAGAQSGGLRPSWVWGLINPDTGLAHYGHLELRQGRHVARITLTDSPATGLTMAAATHPAHDVYDRRFRLVRGQPGVSFTDLFMQEVVQGQDTIYNIAPRPNPATWTKTIRCPWSHAVVGAVRWRWERNDEAIWLACINGCCTATDVQ